MQATPCNEHRVFRFPRLTLNSETQIKKKNPIFHFVKYWKTNGTMKKYCWRGFIWMITPQDNVDKLKS